MQCLGIVGTTRASFAAYNTMEEIDVMVQALQKSLKMLR
jgi:cysteine desulfurase/selenocysteine lyase